MRFNIRLSTYALATAALVTSSLSAQEIIMPGQANRGTPPGNANPKANAYLVNFAANTPKNTRAMAALTAGVQLRHNYDNIDAMSVTAPNENALNALKRHGSVVSVVPDYIVQTMARPGGGGGGGTSGGPVANTQQVTTYAVQRVGESQSGSDGTGIGIAVLDTGIDFNHNDLKPNLSTASYNAINPGTQAQDDNGHGTHVAGLIGAQNNNIAITGVAPNAKLYAVKVLGADSTGTDSQVIAGLDWVLTNAAVVTPKIRVVNMSLGRPMGMGESNINSPFLPIIRQLYNRGISVVVSAGNDPNREISQMVPAAHYEVLPVASTVAMTGVRTCLLFGDVTLGFVPADTAAGTTTDGAGMLVSAPGEERTDIVNLGGTVGCVGLEYGNFSTTRNTQGATRKVAGTEARGTSFAAPLVSGIVARILQRALVPATGNNTEVDGIRTWIRNNASRKGEAPLAHPWLSIYTGVSDGTFEGIAQAPK